MEQIFICLLMRHKFTNLKQNILKFQQVQYVKNISKGWSEDNMKRNGFTGHVYDFSVDYNVTDDDIQDIHKYLMKKNDIV